MDKLFDDNTKIDMSKVDDKYLNVVKTVLEMNDKDKKSLTPTWECFENICHFIDAFPNLCDEDYIRLSRYNYEEEWFCYLYKGLGDDIKLALDYCSSYNDEIQDMYLHYLIFTKYLGNNIRSKKYLYANLKEINILCNEARQKVVKKYKTQEKRELGVIMNYSFRNFQKNAIIRFLNLETYNYLKNNLYKCDVSIDPKYQTKFNSFYRVRRDEQWRNTFYSYFESIKNKKDISFDEILDYMYIKTGNIEASFCSKLLSTINPNMPIWDQYVLKNLNLKVEGKTKKERLESSKQIYNKIIENERKIMEENDVKHSIKEFKDFFKEFDISDIKALDYILWNARD